MRTEALQRLLAWASPAFPVGAYSYSHGLEYAVAEGLVHDRATLAQWVEGILRFGAGRLDGGFFKLAYDAAGTDDSDLPAIVEHAALLRGCAEARRESERQGAAFWRAVRAAWPCPRFDALGGRLSGRAPPYCCAVALAAWAHGVPRGPALIAFLHALASNLVSAGVRLIPLGQSDGLRVIAGLEGTIGEVAGGASGARLRDIASATAMVDWTMMRHEAQYTRLFQS